MMTVIWWFIYHRWKFTKWVRGESFSQRILLTEAAWRNNLCNCRKYPVIHRDMVRILIS